VATAVTVFPFALLTLVFERILQSRSDENDDASEDDEE
jgi:hypothetical protein